MLFYWCDSLVDRLAVSWSERFSSPPSCWRAVEQEGRAERSLLLYEVYTCSSVVPTIGLIFFISGGMQGGKIGSVAEGTEQSQKIQFLLGFVLWGFFSTDFPHELHSVSKFHVFKAWLIVITVYTSQRWNLITAWGVQPDSGPAYKKGLGAGLRREVRLSPICLPDQTWDCRLSLEALGPPSVASSQAELPSASVGCPPAEQQRRWACRVVVRQEAGTAAYCGGYAACERFGFHTPS